LAAIPQSAKPKVRIQTLDVIRGLSILGILAVNADGFAAPQAASLRPETWPFANEGWTAMSYWIMDTLFHDKFVALFSMLFGVSIFLVGGDGADKRKSRLLVRRLCFLFLFGMLHGFGIWWGDILSLYAVAGVAMYFCRSWKAGWLLAIGLTLYGGMACLSVPQAALPFASPQARMEAQARLVPDPGRLAARKDRIARDMAEAKSSWEGAYKLNTRQYLNLLSGNRHIILQTLGLMMIGLSLFKSGFLAGRSSPRRYETMMLVGAPALAVLGWLSWQTAVLQRPILGAHAVILLLSPLVALAYASGLMLTLKAGAGRLLSPLAATGRMAFTNYLTQSLIMTTIFYGGRGALMGEIDRPGLWAITVAVWTLQLIWSPLWLSRFEMGPFEWLWRCLTAGARMPFRKRNIPQEHDQRKQV
jgi:uncharacterized protein